MDIIMCVENFVNMIIICDYKFIFNGVMLVEDK